jgi:hypothetical protein
MADERHLAGRCGRGESPPIVTRGQPKPPPGIALFFVEEVRKHLERQQGAKVRRNGLSGGRSIALQDAANKAIEYHRGAATNGTDGGSPGNDEGRHTVDGFKDERWTRPLVVGDVVPAVVVTPKTGAARLRVGLSRGPNKEGYASTRKTSAADLFEPGDLVERSRNWTTPSTP